MASDRDVVLHHYRNVARRYDRHLSYADDFVPRLCTVIAKKLALRPEDRFVDLGGGTGLYTAGILEQVPLLEPPLLVDPIADMLEQVPSSLPVRCLQADALGFAETPGTYDKVLMKESVHHVDDRGLLFRRLRERLAPGGALLLVHVPPWIDYPLFDAARERALGWHANPDELVELLGDAGFEVERGAFEYGHSIPTDRYLGMVADRYMSVLSTFGDDELEDGLREMEERHAGRDVLTFTDRFDVILGSTPLA